MSKVKLSEVAKVELSSIDKKISPDEISVKLCNFTDIYYNWAITKDIIESCMDGSVNETEYKKQSLKKGQVAITKDSETRDDIGIPCYISNNFENAVLGYHCALITPIQDRLNGKYLNALLNTAYARKCFANNASGSGQRFTLSKKAIENIKITLPTLNKQKRIGSFFSDIDKKIQNNKKQIETLESLAKTIYDYWFVQFDFPNEDGKPYKSSGGKMVWNEDLKMEIPDGWKVGNLYSIADFINGLACQKFRAKNGEKNLPVIKIKEMHDGVMECTERVSENIPSKYKVFDGDILFSWSATLAVIFWFGGNGGLNQHIFKVNPKLYFSKEYVYELLSSYIVNFIKIAEARKTTMGHITTAHLEQSKIFLPPESIINIFTKRIQPIYLKIGLAKKENRKMIKLRNESLPLLMNGQVSIE